MRLVSWNCHDAFGNKAPALLDLKPDIAVLSEVKEQHVEQFKSRGSVLFAGESPKKGLAVIGWNGWKLERAGEVAERWFLPLIATRGAHQIHMLAMWVLPTKNYVTPTLNELGRHKEFLSAENSIVVGDFNQNVKFDKGRKGNRTFASVLELLDANDLSSVWHKTKREDHGEESENSLYFRYNEAQGYHIDYAFVSPPLMDSVSSVSLGSHEHWVKTKLSDHVPLSVTFNF